MLMVASCALVLGFRSSSNLAAAYGLAVTGIMLITTLMLCVVAHRRWRWSPLAVAALAALLLPVEGAFLGANLLKITHGGWFSLLVAGAAFAVMSTWQRGRRILAERLEETTLPLDLFLPDLETSNLPRVPGTAVFLTTDPQGTPLALLHNIKHNQVAHEQTICLTVATEEVPVGPPSERVLVKDLGNGFFRVVIRYGFMELPNVPAVLDIIGAEGVSIDAARTSYFLGREKLIPSGHSGMARWRESLFAFLSQNSQSAMAWFRIPPDRVIELGAQVKL
jgi:KUP system potassium uptake protein